MADRYVEILVEGEYKKDLFTNLQIGDIFKIYEPNGVLVLDPNGKSVFKATGRPYGSPLGVVVDTLE